MNKMSHDNGTMREGWASQWCSYYLEVCLTVVVDCDSQGS